MKTDITTTYNEMLDNANKYVTNSIIERFGGNNENIPLRNKLTFNELIEDFSADIIFIDKLVTRNGIVYVHIFKRETEYDMWYTDDYNQFFNLDELIRVEIISNILF